MHGPPEAPELPRSLSLSLSLYQPTSGNTELITTPINLTPPSTCQ